jgi:hypothetical protein
MMVVCGSQAAPGGITGSAGNAAPFGEQAAMIFAGQLARARNASTDIIRMLVVCVMIIPLRVHIIRVIAKLENL